jgi:hypothetical protein
MFLYITVILSMLVSLLFAEIGPKSEQKFLLNFKESVHPEPITGRAYVILSKVKSPEPRFLVQNWYNPIPFFGTDFERVVAGKDIVIDDKALGYPVESLADLPAGKYYIQALIHIYTQFKREDGYTIWAPMDQWEGQQFNRSPGNLFSLVDSVTLDPNSGYNIKITLNQKIPTLVTPPDTKLIKHIKLKSNLLSTFWGQPIFLGAAVLLPQGYHDSKEKYPVIYKQGHFSEGNQFRQNSNFYQKWTSAGYPKMILVHFFHPTPYYDDSYAINSENCGPYGDAILTELIPAIENELRIIREPWARLLYGCSTGGWISLALQVFHPDFFGGTWTMAPDPVDFSSFQLINIYEQKNAYYLGNQWLKNEIPLARDNHGHIRLTVRQFCQMEMVKGSKGRSGDQLDAFFAVFGPVGDDGYPKPLWDKTTGVIDTSVASYFKENFDLRFYMEKNWSWLGPKLVGKLHFICGDMDNYYLNEAMYKLEKFLENTSDPYYEGSFIWGRPNKGHCWTPWGRDQEKLFQIFETYLEKNRPERW